MPKKNGLIKTFSLDKQIVEELEFLSKYYFLKPTSLLEFIINKEYNSVNGNKEHTN